MLDKVPMMTTKIWVQLYKDLIAHDNRPRARTRRAVHAAGHNAIGPAQRYSIIGLKSKVEQTENRKSGEPWVLLVIKSPRGLLIKVKILQVFLISMKDYV